MTTPVSTTELTLPDAIQARFARRADRPALTFLADGETEGAETYSFAELDRAARVVAADLQTAGVRPGDRVMLLQRPGRHMVSGFLGCSYAGALAVYAYPPNPFLGARGGDRLRTILENAGATAVLTTTSLVPLLQLEDEAAPTFSWVFTDEPASSADAFEPVAVDPDDVAFLQYTSGSTSEPRGVRVTHRALLANVELMAEAFGLHEDSVACSWAPPSHDLGLIGMILTPLLVGFHTVQMTPEAFMRRPERWLKAITHYRATYAGAPNFAYEDCVRRIGDLDGIDLSSWEIAINGGEPVREQTLEKFVRKFADCGFRSSSFFPGFGLAEATLMVSAGRRRPGSTLWVDPEQLSLGRIEPAAADVGQPLVSAGPPASRTTVTICDPATGRPVADGVVGEIQVRGPQICDGYWQRPELSAEIFPDGVLRTGDLGALWEGELYVTGRLKDMLIIRGFNHYPQDIEQTMEAADPTLRPGCGVAVAVPTDSGELVVLIQAVERNGKDGDPEQVVDRIRRRVVQEHGVSADAIVLVRPASIPKTASGKVQRSTAAEAFRAGTLSVVHQWTAAES